MISTGINGLDEMLGGGIPKGSSVLYSMEPGVDGQIFMISTLISALSREYSCLVVLPHTTVEAFRYEAAGKRGCSLTIFNKNVVFIDAADRERIEKAAKTRKAAKAAWETRIKKLCTENKVDCAFVYLDLLYEDFGLDTALSLAQVAKVSGKTTLIIEHLNLEGQDLPVTFTERDAFDLIIAIRSSFHYLPRFSYFTLIHTAWSDIPKRSVPFIVTGGKVVPYITRIVVTGPAQGGKSTFVANASDMGFSVDRHGPDGEKTTVAMDFGWLKSKDFEITLYGTPGQERFDPVVPMLFSRAMGAVLLVDATRPETLERARYHLRLIKERHLPHVIAANKCDLPGATGDREIRTRLGIHDEVPVFFISAHRKADVRLVVESLVDSITHLAV